MKLLIFLFFVWCLTLKINFLRNSAPMVIFLLKFYLKPFNLSYQTSLNLILKKKNVRLTHNSTPDVRRGRGCVIKVDWGMLRELRVWRKRIRSDDRQTDKWTNRTSTYRLDPRKGSSKNKIATKFEMSEKCK